ncbi:alpha/beta hydrolase [Schlegelella sp. ID0723]|uniref:Alpha/beta hydrolase n=2 Tax=Piscinibacter koreensis TaxID=2742824 RepID=A0A7Y6NKB5_9BURK|nr:alpha/beta hydrolase [Schlegelella koreensis]
MLLAGCGALQPTRVPLRTIALAAPCATPASTLVVFLPGSYSTPEDFVAHGFVDALRRQRVAADLLLVDAHLGYYSERSVLERLRADVLAPAGARGYREVWLVGISIGAYGALLHAATARGAEPSVAGIVAIAPYLGEYRITQSIGNAGGLVRWSPPGWLDADAADVALWRWLQRAAAGATSTRLYLAYGRSDRFATSDRLLDAALPAGRAFTAPGGHDWPVWEALWRDLAPALPLPRDAACEVPREPARPAR